MPALRTLALTVHELEQGEFHWLLMETQSPPDLQATQPYLPLAAGERPHANYRTALLEGMGTLRRMAGTNGPRGC
ncbi:hypothetical protein [Variovorax ginsengisoli]|uniref:Uncharacterized protein n=1 Tax=Variovorax ginsengisoli TaxID=363844 RepID=A0ABT9S6V9_9BURK|nr:hypothetical protein [Variovorax ginsengisoli]MDP9900098.1 hypothetical protein [Variovorax ginsengisoli]